MADKKPIRTVFNDSNVATGLAEFQTGETIGLAHGGLGAALSLGTAGQVLKVNSGASALEFGAVEAIINIDTATDLTGQTLASSDQLMVSDGGTEGRATLGQLGPAIANVPNSALTNSTINFGGVSLALGATDTTPAFDLSDATSYPTSSLTGTITNAQLAGSIANAKLSNSTVTIGTTAIALGASNTTIAGISNLTAGGINITGNSITSADSTIIEMGEGLSVTGNLTVSGNFTVSGTTTTVSSTNTTLADQFIELGTGRTGSATGDAGIVIERGNDANAIIGFDESADEFTVGTGTFTGSSTGNLTITKGTFSSAANRIYNGTNYVELVSPSLGGNVVLTLPANDGDTNQLLSTDGSGNLSFISATAASGAGLSNVSDDTSPTLGGDLDADSKIIKNIKLLDHDLLGASYGPSSAPVTITVTVASKTAAHPYNGDGSSSAYFLNGIESPAIQLHGADNVTSDSGYYYRFDQADSSNGSHPLRFYLDADKTTAYTSGVTTNGTPGQAGAYTQIDVDEDTPSILYYQCSSHAYMGNYATVPASNKINHTEALISMPTTTGTLVGTGDTGSVSNGMLANSTITIGSTAIALGASNTTIAGIVNLTAGGINITGNSITSADSTVIEVGESVSVTGALDVSTNLTIGGNLTVNGTTTSIETTNSAVTDNIFELNKGNSNNTNDSGLIIERGSAGDNAIMMWDESADKFVVGTTSATADSTGNISHTKANFEAAEVKGSSGNFVSTGISAVMTVTGTDDGAGEGPDIVIKRNSASPADDDILGALVFKGENDADQAVTYGKVRARALDVSDGTEDGQLEFSTIKAGSITSLATMDSTGLYLNQSLGLFFEGDGADAHELKLVAADGLSGDVTVTLPAATDTLIGKATTDTLTNKTLTSPKVNEDVAVTATATQLNHTVGVTSAIQTQLDAKASSSFAIAQAVALG